MDPESSPAQRPRISAVVVAGDAGSTIARTLESILDQTLPPDHVLVVVAGSRDDTFSIARTWNGRHEHGRAADPAAPASTTVTVIDRGPREDSLRSAYDFAFRLVRDSDLVLLVSPEAELDARVLELLAAELGSDPQLTLTAARLESRPSGSRGPLAGARRLLQRHWAVGAIETGTDLGITGPVPLAPATLLRMPAIAPDEGGSGDVLSVVLAGGGRSSSVSDARASVDTAVSWATLRSRRDGWGAYVRRLAREGSGATASDRRRARLAALRITTGPVLRALAFALAALYLLVAGIQGALHPAWWWALPVVVRLPLHVRTMRRIRERGLADVIFGVTFVPLEIGEMAYGVSRIRGALRRIGPRSARRPAAPGGRHPFHARDAALLVVVVLAVAVSLGLAVAGGEAGADAASAIGWLACIAAALDIVIALTRLLVRRGGMLSRSPRRWAG